MADKMLKIELKKSLIGRGAKQIATAEALGLKLSLIHISCASSMPSTSWRTPAASKQSRRTSPV